MSKKPTNLFGKPIAAIIAQTESACRLTCDLGTCTRGEKIIRIEGGNLMLIYRLGYCHIVPLR